MPKSILSDLDFVSAARITNLPNAVAAGQPVTFDQLNAAIEGLAWKDSVRAATQGNISIASPGATIDDVSMVANDRVLVRAQTAASENGIYIWNGAAVPATRALDASTAGELEQAVVSVEEASSANSTFRQTSVNFTLGATAINWVSFGVSAPAATETTAGIAEIATQAETDAGTDDIRFITPLKLATLSGRMRRFTQTIGDASATSFTITHNFNTRDVQVEVYRNSGNFDSVLADVLRTSTNAVQIVTAAAPALNAFRVVVFG